MKSTLIHLVVVILGGILVGAGYLFWYVTVSEKSAEVASLATQIVDATNNVKHIASARAALSEIAGDEAKIQGYFVPASNVVNFITSLQSIGQAQKSKVEVISVAKTGTKTHPTLQFSLTIKGTFDSVMRTFGAIEYAPYDISIGTLSVVRTTGKQWQASVILTVGSALPSVASSTTKTS